MVAGPVFIAVFLVTGAMRDDYSALRHPVSTLALGGAGWTQCTNFLLTGSLVLLGAVGLRRSLGEWRWVAALVGLAGIGLIGAGLFDADPLNGYPPGTPVEPTERSAAGRAHDAWSALVFFGLPTASFVMGRRFLGGGRRTWGAISIGAGTLIVGAFILAALGLRQVGELDRLAGLFQRLAIGAGFGWLSLVSVYFWHATGDDVRDETRAAQLPAIGASYEGAGRS
jgi:hypothetical membrane protein